MRKYTRFSVQRGIHSDTVFEGTTLGECLEYIRSVISSLNEIIDDMIQIYAENEETWDDELFSYTSVYRHYINDEWKEVLS